ncbi:Dyp-type peroxidase [Streptomyces sp. NPDC052042]|uniref:Dyp-type peroxidase n=1 Tax=Streptomyces sp. NPDC052042 TaxID=3365683 RepID=UPI0037D32223
MPDAPPDPAAQPVVAPLSSAALILVATVEPGGEAVVREVLPDLPAIARSIGFRFPDARLATVTGFGSDVWDRLFAGPRPAGLHPFRELRGARHHAPATPGDLLFHVRAERMDVCYEWASQLLDRLRPAVGVVDETQGFRYFDHRDLLGFVDGTENPVGADARSAALVGAEDPDFAGGSYVVVQKYVHDLAAWNRLSTEEQERVIGRTKFSDVELPDEVKPADSHVALNTITEPDGTSREILRANMPFGSFGQGEFGTYFIGYAADPDVTERMLRNMFLGDPPGVHDRILDFSTAVTGTLFYAPAAGFFDSPPPSPTAAATAHGAPSETVPRPVPAPTHAQDPAAVRPDDGSLHIGSLQESAQ